MASNVIVLAYRIHPCCVEKARFRIRASRRRVRGTYKLLYCPWLYFLQLVLRHVPMWPRPNHMHAVLRQMCACGIVRMFCNRNRANARSSMCHTTQSNIDLHELIEHRNMSIQSLGGCTTSVVPHSYPRQALSNVCLCLEVADIPHPSNIIRNTIFMPACTHFQP